MGVPTREFFLFHKAQTLQPCDRPSQIVFIDHLLAEKRRAKDPISTKSLYSPDLKPSLASMITEVNRGRVTNVVVICLWVSWTVTVFVMVEGTVDAVR